MPSSNFLEYLQMPAPQKYPKPDPKGKFLVIPYRQGFSPFLTSEPFTESCDESAVICFETLIAIQEKLKAIDKIYIQPLKNDYCRSRKSLQKK